MAALGLIRERLDVLCGQLLPRARNERLHEPTVARCQHGLGCSCGDNEGDVLNPRRGARQAAADTYGTPKAAVRLDETAR